MAEENNLPRMDVLKYMDTGQLDLTATTLIYKIATLRGGQAVVIKALVGNTGNIYLGKKDVTTTTGFELSPGESLKIEYLPDKETTEYLDIWLVPATAGDDACFILVP